MQSELPKPETLSSDYEFEWSTFLDENWFFLLGFLLVVAIVIFYTIHRKKQNLKK